MIALWHKLWDTQEIDIHKITFMT